MSVHYVLSEFLSFFPFILQGAIALVMIRRKLVTIFPFFFSYTIGVLCTDVPLTFLPYGHRAYSTVYWSGEALAISLGFTVIFEILRHILPSHPSLTLLMNLVFFGATVAAVIVVLILVSAKPGTGTDWLLEDIVLAERFLRFLQASLLMVVIALMSVLGLTWQHESLGILAGFGVYSSVALVVFEFGYHLHLMSTTAFMLLDSAGYNVAVLIWAFYILRPRQRTTVEHPQNADLAKWINTLNDDADQWSRRY